ncbi:unnamed protein product [Ciceribacter selenitireducens ATCC BAA-1503]|uniref:Uncharacterized protein n=1 Tax=Ciceribacter selenitireducens ATCC BAA-1503 TaxID=1336235 RepID=A0A376AAE0_9HYPH|nr:unnamed protein product [Ciceribacter selenitireducens ATCC BAA-1503]
MKVFGRCSFDFAQYQAGKLILKNIDSKCCRCKFQAMSSLANSFAWQLRKNCVLSLGQIDVHDRAGEQVFHGVFFAELELNLLPAAVNNGAQTHSGCGDIKIFDQPERQI